MANAIPGNFRPESQVFQLVDKWPVAMSRETALDKLTNAFEQQGLSTKDVGHDLWIEISRDWHGGPGRHGDAARFMKNRPSIRLNFNETDGVATICAYSQTRSSVGVYDVVQLPQEMGESAVAQAREATT